MCQGPLISEGTLIITADETLCTIYFTYRLTSHHCIAKAPYKPVCRLRSPKLGTGTKIAPDSTKPQLPSCKFFWLPKVLHHPHAPSTSTQLSPTSFYFAWSNEDVQNFYKWKLEKWNVQKLYKWKVSVCNNKAFRAKSTVEQCVVFRLFLQSTRTPNHSLLTGKSFFSTFRSKHLAIKPRSFLVLQKECLCIT